MLSQACAPRHVIEDPPASTPLPRWLSTERGPVLSPDWVILDANLHYGQLYRFGDERARPPHGVSVQMEANAFSIISDYGSQYATDLRAAKGLISIPLKREVANENISPRHKGVDIYAPIGTPVLAMSSGRVEQISKVAVAGNTLTLVHAKGLETYYVHLDDTLVSVGERVARGQIIATVGTTGSGSGSTPHLHVEMREFGQIVNPHYYWYKGRGAVTLYRPGQEYFASPSLMTYPLPDVRDIKQQQDWANFGLKSDYP